MKSHVFIIVYIFAIILNLINGLNTNVLSSLIQDPRKNSTFYDLILKENVPYGSIIGNLADVLMHKNSIDKNTKILNFKLIYYSPQLIPSTLISSSKNQNQTYQAPLEPIFSVDNQNGSIYIKTPNEPILEYLCSKKSYCSCLSCIFSLNIIFSTENKVNAETIRLFIDDHNDYIPEFSSKEKEIMVNVSESSQIGDSFKLINAIAFDSDAFYNEISYYISDRDIISSTDKSELRSNLFEVAPISSDSKDLNLILKTHLDYEKLKSYELYLVAKDNGYPISYKISKKLIINVLDENDNSPICEKSLYIESLKENKIERDFLQIRASDLDSGYNARLQFSILSDSKVENLFEIDKMTGWLSLKQPLDYEKKQYYELKIQVNDTGLKNTFMTHCMARINVLDLNDNAAQMKIIKYLNESVQRGYYSVNTMSDNGDSDDEFDIDNRLDFNLYSNHVKNQIEFYENNQEDLVLALIRVFDRDTISNYKFSIQSATNSHEDTSMFEIRMSDKSNREYELVSVGSFNSELIQNYRLRIVLYDLQDFSELDDPSHLMLTKVPSLTDNQNAFQISLFERVKILDLNDNRPEFVKKHYQFKVKENKINKSLISADPIEIYDLDTSETNSKLKFKILDKHNSTCIASQHLNINDSISSSPVLIVSKPFDFEAHGDEIEFDLMAQDVDNLSDTCTITIKIEDVNDNPPVFMNDNMTFVIKENMPANSFIGQVIAIDKDSPGVNSDINYRIVSEQYKSHFKIYKTGVVSNWLAFDRETQSFYTLKIEAYDNGKPSLNTIGTYYIQIEDENDNKPKFMYPNENISYMNIKLPQFQLFPKSKTLIKVFDVKAFDNDYEDNGRLNYFIDDSLNLLKIDRINGSVYFNLTESNITDLVQLNSFQKIINVFLKVTDSGHPILSSSVNFTLYFNYDLEELPLNVQKIIQGSSKVDEDKIELTKTSLFKFSPEKYKNFFQIVSNSVLLIILLVILLFMLFIACFIIIIMYKRIDEKRKNKSESNHSESNSIFKCIYQVKDFFKSHFTLSKVSKFKNIHQISRRIKHNEHLTVKDATNIDKLDPTLGNTFKITIKNIDPKSSQNQLIIDSFTKVNDSSVEINQENKSASISESNGTNYSEEYSDELNVYSQEISINDLYRNTLTKKHLSESKLVINDDVNLYSNQQFGNPYSSINQHNSLNKSLTPCSVALVEASSNSIKRNIINCDDKSDIYQNQSSDLLLNKSYFKNQFKFEASQISNSNDTAAILNENKNSIKHIIGSQSFSLSNPSNRDPICGLIEKFEKFYNVNPEFSEISNQNTNNGYVYENSL